MYAARVSSVLCVGRVELEGAAWRSRVLFLVAAARVGAPRGVSEESRCAAQENDCFKLPRYNGGDLK
eukprot:443594-Prymnesium_polylepis.1